MLKVKKKKKRKREEQQDEERRGERERIKAERSGDERLPEGSDETHGGGFWEKKDESESDEKGESWRIPEAGGVLTSFCGLCHRITQNWLIYFGGERESSDQRLRRGTSCRGDVAELLDVSIYR